jgi:DNA-binding transcriptional regulator YdaS (Cro superfamily)
VSRRDWPNRTDSQQDIDRAIAASYRAELMAVAPERCLVLDRAARHLGQHWIAPLPEDMDLDEHVPTSKAARLLGVEESTIRSWGSRPWVPVTRYPDGWNMRELLAYKASQAQQRARRSQPKT